MPSYSSVLTPKPEYGDPPPPKTSPAVNVCEFFPLANPLLAPAVKAPPLAHAAAVTMFVLRVNSFVFVVPLGREGLLPPNCKPAVPDPVPFHALAGAGKV